MSHTFTIMARTDQEVEGPETVTVCMSSTANVDFEPNDITISIVDATSEWTTRRTLIVH